MKRIATILILVVSLVVLGIATGINASSEEVPTYKFGIDASAPPWTRVEKGVVKGFDVDLFEYIGKTEGFKVEFVDLPWSTIISALSKGKIDILGGGLSFTCQRAKIIDYALPHTKIGHSLVVRKDSKLNAITALSKGHKIGCHVGTTGYRWLKTQLVEKGVDLELVGTPTNDLGIKDVESGRTVAFFLDGPQAQGFIKAGRNVKEVAANLGFDINAYGITPGDPYDLIPKINDGIKKAHESGKWGEIIHRYMPGQEVEVVPFDVNYVVYCEVQEEPLPPEQAERAKENYEKFHRR